MTERTPSAVRFGVRRVIAALEDGGTAFFGWFDVQKLKRLGRDPKRCGGPSGSTALQRLFQTDVWFEDHRVLKSGDSGHRSPKRFTSGGWHAQNEVMGVGVGTGQFDFGSVAMRIPVLIEPISEQRFRASGAAWEMSAEGQTSEEALERLRQEVQQRLSHGSKVTFLDTEQLAPDSKSKHPLARFAGCMKDDPLYDEWQTAVAEYRASCDRDGA